MGFASWGLLRRRRRRGLGEGDLIEASMTVTGLDRAFPTILKRLPRTGRTALLAVLDVELWLAPADKLRGMSW